jgi:RNA polymerase sigma-70 factor, ECF subfamily
LRPPDKSVHEAPGPDREARLRAFAEHSAYLRRTLRRFGVASRDLDDLAQDVFVVMCRRWADYQPDRPLRAWLTGIAVHVAHKHARGMGRETQSGDVDREDDTPRADERLDAEQARALVHAALQCLPPQYRAVLALRDIDNVPMRQVAGMLEIPLFTAYSRLRRARQLFSRLTWCDLRAPA